MCGCVQYVNVFNLCMCAIYEYMDNTKTIDSPPETENKIKLECETCKKSFKTESEMSYHYMNMTYFC